MNAPTPMSCKQCVERLGDFLDRELTSEEVALVNSHLDHCADCAREFRFEGAVVESLKATLRRVKAPPTLLERIRRLIG